MRRRLTTFRVATSIATLMLVVALGVGASPHLQARIRILGTRLIVIAATMTPASFSSLLSTALRVGGAGSRRAAPMDEHGGPILVISAAANPFSRYVAEILRAEGLNELAMMDVSLLTPTALRAHDVVVLGEMPLDAAQVTMLSDWTSVGGTLVALRPDPRLAGVLGLTPAGGTVSDGYLRVNTAVGPGVGIVGETMQFHGSADLWAIRTADRGTPHTADPRTPRAADRTTDDATMLATLYTDADTPSRFPAVTWRRVGAHGGVAVAFVYDLARSVVYTRQGNPAWAGQERDGMPPMRSVDLFFGHAAFDPQPEWVDFAKLAIPQADEQQRLLANVILQGNLHRKPLPRFWYLPKGLNAAIVMTGDGHDDTGVPARFDMYREASPAGCSVDDWECVRATVYLYVGTTFTPTEAERYTRLGFEVALHVNTNCVDWNPTSLEFLIGLQMREFRAAFPGIPAPSTSRTHCAAWSDWSTQPEIEAAHGVRLDTSYYFFPASWARNRAGMFTGSGFPMRFAARDGSVIDCYQAATQIPDESGLALPEVCDQLLDRANGPEGYYGVFTTNMHFDSPDHPGSNAVVASARAHGIPVVSARQMLAWLDGRNRSSFEALSWDGDTLGFTVEVGAGARNLQGMLPLLSAAGPLSGLTRDGSRVAYSARTIKGIDYAFFSAEAGRYAAGYGRTRPPT